MIEIDEAKKYRRQKKHFHYNQFFHPSVCHVCKSADQSNLILCARCNMISYCSEQHRKIHHPRHKEICSIIAKFIDEDPEWNTRSLHNHEWIKSQDSLVRMIRMMLKREMKPYEEQMFMYAKSCYVCHRRSNLYTCEHCISFSYCANHIPLVLSDIHNSVICDLLALILKLDIKSLDPSVWKAVHVKFSAFPNKKKPFTNMASFCKRYFPPRKEDLYWCLYEHIFTDYVSGPLTLYNGLQIANLFHTQMETNTFVIHIIAANYVDRCHFPAWELFLHLLSKTKKLVIIMIGPELQDEVVRYDTCCRCKMRKKKLILQSFPLLYHDYTSSIKHRRPNMIIGFQAELNAGGTWSKSIKAIQAQDCPLLLTAKSSCKILKDINKIQEVLSTSVKPVLEIKNKFFSYRPYKDFETGYVSYRNTYLIIYKNLNDLNDSNEAI